MRETSISTYAGLFLLAVATAFMCLALQQFIVGAIKYDNMVRQCTSQGGNFNHETQTCELQDDVVDSFLGEDTGNRD